MRWVEAAATLFTAAAVLLAGLNSIHNWWMGIVGCVLFGWVFFEARLYADVTLQLFFIVTNAVGWWTWAGGRQGTERPVHRTPASWLAAMSVGGALVAAGYGWLLHRFTDAYAPFVDSAVLAFSVVAQLLLVWRSYESWWFWLLVNTLSVPLYLSRGLVLTALLYAAFWVNAVVALVRWRRLLRPA
ncbi:MAG TPA: nicotinamide riboside transporter PnuC [Longimicrobiaceae bacterium]|nr:nicotinamide riboside transporter PnuC [Longimicrobiaceae bacterium]